MQLALINRYCYTITLLSTGIFYENIVIEYRAGHHHDLQNILYENASLDFVNTVNTMNT